MNVTRHLTPLFVAVLMCVEVCSADEHRVLVMSAINDGQRNELCELRVMEVPSGREIAGSPVGASADTALSHGRDLVAVTSRYQVAGVAEPQARLEIFRTSDLSLVQSGQLPVRRTVYRQVPNRTWMYFSPDSTELIIQRMAFLADDAPFRNTVDDVILTRLKLNEVDNAGMFKISGQLCKIPRAIRRFCERRSMA